MQFLNLKTTLVIFIAYLQSYMNWNRRIIVFTHKAHVLLTSFSIFPKVSSGRKTYFSYTSEGMGNFKLHFSPWATVKLSGFDVDSWLKLNQKS